VAMGSQAALNNGEEECSDAEEELARGRKRLSESAS